MDPLMLKSKSHSKEEAWEAKFLLIFFRYPFLIFFIVESWSFSWQVGWHNPRRLGYDSLGMNLSLNIFEMQ